MEQWQSSYTISALLLLAACSSLFFFCKTKSHVIRSWPFQIGPAKDDSHHIKHSKNTILLPPCFIVGILVSILGTGNSLVCLIETDTPVSLTAHTVKETLNNNSRYDHICVTTLSNFNLPSLQHVPLAGSVRSLSGTDPAVPPLSQRGIQHIWPEEADAGRPGWCNWCVCECWTSLEQVRDFIMHVSLFIKI